MNLTRRQVKIITVSILVGIITILHYGTQRHDIYRHIFYQELYFIPLILGGFWFGLRGGLITSVAISLFYLPQVVMHWSGFSAFDFYKLLELSLFNGVAFVLGFISDRERKQQKRLRETESLTAMGETVSMVAHDMKTPLVAIGGFAHLVQKRLDKDNDCQEKMEVILNATKKLEGMITDMLAFAGTMTLKRAPGNINKVVADILPIVEEIAKNKKVYLQTKLSENLPTFDFDHARIGQVLINLITNAIQASSEGGIVTISSRGERRKVVLAVVDHGCGIPSNKKKEIFSPFFTTKTDGTGLGLAIVKKIIEAHEGQLEVLENIERGMTFKVVLALK
jgi:two-component system, NtrC family, sensor histidine kinase HydH